MDVNEKICDLLENSSLIIKPGIKKKICEYLLKWEKEHQVSLSGKRYMWDMICKQECLSNSEYSTGMKAIEKEYKQSVMMTDKVKKILKRINKELSKNSDRSRD